MSAQPLPSTRALVVRAPAATPSTRAITSRAELTGPGLRLLSFAFGEEAELSEHCALRPALVQIVRGECEFRIGTEAHHLRAGDIVWMPPGTPHAVRALGSFTMWLTLFGDSDEPAQPLTITPRFSPKDLQG